MAKSRWMDILLPRFITEPVAFAEDGDHLVPVCAVADLEPYERPPFVGMVKSFNLFGLAILPRLSGDLIPWNEWEGL